MVEDVITNGIDQIHAVGDNVFILDCLLEKDNLLNYLLWMNFIPVLEHMHQTIKNAADYDFRIHLKLVGDFVGCLNE